MNTPTLLAIDSSTDVLCLAACAGDRAAFWYGAGGAQASAVLLGHAHELMAQVGAPLASLDAVAFGRGPGAFTGLRTACAAAQGLAFGVDCAVLPIDSLMLVAQAAAQQSDKLAGGDFARPCIVGVAMDARMGELYAGVYARTAGRWQAVQEPCLTKPDEWALFWQVQTEKMQAEKQLQEPTQAPPLIWLAGSGLALLPPAALAASTVVHTAERDRVAALLALAQAQWQSGAALAPAQALPLYVRDNVAQTTAQRLAAAGLAAAAADR